MWLVGLVRYVVMSLCGFVVYLRLVDLQGPVKYYYGPVKLSEITVCGVPASGGSTEHRGVVVTEHRLHRATTRTMIAVVATVMMVSDGGGDRE